MCWRRSPNLKKDPDRWVDEARRQWIHSGEVVSSIAVRRIKFLGECAGNSSSACASQEVDLTPGG